MSIVVGHVEHVAEERARRIGIIGIKDCVGGDNHPGSFPVSPSSRCISGASSGTGIAAGKTPY